MLQEHHGVLKKAYNFRVCEFGGFKSVLRDAAPYIGSLPTEFVSCLNSRHLFLKIVNLRIYSI